LFGEAFEYQQTVPFFSLFMATLRADPPVGDADSLRRLGGSADLRYWVVHDLADAIHAAAAQTPLAIVLEDLHWADNGTLLALRSLASPGPDMPVLWVLTVRTGAGGPALQETLSVLHRANAAVLRVAAMSPSAVADMVQDAVRANADESLLNLAAKAHGNPFLVGELVGGLDEEGRLNVSGGRAVASGHAMPRRLGASIQQRLDHLSTGAGEVVRVAAVLPDRFSAGLLAAMLDRQPASLLSAVAEAVRADLLVEDDEQLRFGTTCCAKPPDNPYRNRCGARWSANRRRSCCVRAQTRPRWPPSWHAAPSPETGRRSARCGRPRNQSATVMPVRPRT
jgi:predicted ATPase